MTGDETPPIHGKANRGRRARPKKRFVKPHPGSVIVASQAEPSANHGQVEEPKLPPNAPPDVEGDTARPVGIPELQAEFAAFCWQSAALGFETWTKLCAPALESWLTPDRRRP